MNTSNSECSSGCESGWTMYWDQLSNSTNYYNRAFDNYKYQEKGGAYVYDDQEDENLSMISDASSGPPQPQIQDYFENHASNEQKKNSNQKKIMKQKKAKSQSLYLDDTASSPIFHFSKDNVAYSGIHTSIEHGPGFSQGLATADFEKHLDFFKSSAEGKKASGKSGSFRGKKRQ
ncbi:uncharacterized protein LOC111390125 isoform X2 [Olea europaea var. sylvestris]|uniref:uncharacterized protein LOC111390125 isoform X2 n=1 Tax=Olea europaea var. sylvestris TaxID=158386 RepID=UPI000C1D78FD|nr:uncharacterized protein LOC111390125 isoform X2 [Olea europaea var. sylvestris]